jgi:uncharacterized membrane protein YfcA
VVLVAVATIAGSTLQSATSFGFALVLGPAVFAVFEPAEALTTLLVLGAVLNLLMLFTEGRSRAIRGDRLIALLPWALPGLAIGAVILAALPKPALQVAVGIAVMAAAAVQAADRTPIHARAGGREPVWAAPVAGVTTGVLTTTTSTSGPPLVLWFQRLGLGPTEFRDSLAAAFLALNVLGVLALGAFGDGIETRHPAFFVGLLILTALGHLAGRRLFERLEPDRFRDAGLVLVVLAGIASVAAGLWAS